MYKFLIDFIQSMMCVSVDVVFESYDTSDADEWTLYQTERVKDDNPSIAGHLYELTDIIQIIE